MYGDICGPTSFKLGMVIKTTKFYIMIPVWMTLIIIYGHSCMRKGICAHFLAIFSVDLDEIQCVAKAVGMLKLMLNMLHGLVLSGMLCM